MVHRYEGVRSDLARIAGARMATASEGEDGARLAESIIKQLTGEYAITVRRLYENEFEFTPTAKIWLTTNHEPVIRGTDDGIWRRIWMVPFTVQISEEKGPACRPCRAGGLWLAATFVQADRRAAAILVLLWTTPVAFAVLSEAVGQQCGPLPLLALLAWAVRESFRAPQGATAGSHK